MAALAPKSEQPVLPVAEILDRLRELYDAKNETELARILEVPQSTLSSWKQRGSIPFEVLLARSAQLGVSLDWLIFGRGESDRKVGQIDREVLALAVEISLPDGVVDQEFLPFIVDNIHHYYVVLANVAEALRTAGMVDETTAWQKVTETARRFREIISVEYYENKLQRPENLPRP